MDVLVRHTGDVHEADPAPDLRIDRRAGMRRIDLDARSWIEVHEAFVRDADAELRALLDETPWQQTEVLRYDHYVSERRLSAGLSSASRPLLRQIDLHLSARHHVPFSGVAAILYRDGRDFQGLHSDREMRWLDDTIVAIVVLGARRPFVVRPRAPLSTVADKVPAGSDPSDLVLRPGEGDLLVMGGAFQRDWLHGVPAADTSEPRISLTWRWTSRRGRPDTNPTFYDGRHFRDGPRLPGSRGRRR
jgi:alkylated DNA repair dioxygenase AlkB